MTWLRRSYGSRCAARPRLGVAGAMGVALAARQFRDDPAGLAAAVRSVRSARPTAVNLARGVDLAAAALPEGEDAVLKRALSLRDAEIVASEQMARRGADLVTELCRPMPNLLTHCNTGGLATVTGGTALARRRGAASARPARRRHRERDPAAAAGRPADRVGTRPARHRASGGRGRGRTVPHGPWRGGRGDPWCGPDLRQR